MTSICGLKVNICQCNLSSTAGHITWRTSYTHYTPIHPINAIYWGNKYEWVRVTIILLQCACTSVLLFHKEQQEDEFVTEVGLEQRVPSVAAQPCIWSCVARWWGHCQSISRDSIVTTGLITTVTSGISIAGFVECTVVIYWPIVFAIGIKTWGRSEAMIIYGHLVIYYSHNYLWRDSQLTEIFDVLLPLISCNFLLCPFVMPLFL